MGRPPKVANAIDNKQHHKERDKLDKRLKVEIELQPTSRNLLCPEYLTNEAKTEWKRIVAIDSARKMPVIYDSDIGLLQVLCELWACWLIAQREWSQKQTTILKSNDKMIANPFIVEMRKLAKDMKPLYAEFGLTPRGRAQMGVDMSKKNDDDNDDLFK